MSLPTDERGLEEPVPTTDPIAQLMSAIKASMTAVEGQIKNLQDEMKRSREEVGSRVGSQKS